MLSANFEATRAMQIMGKNITYSVLIALPGMDCDKIIHLNQINSDSGTLFSSSVYFGVQSIVSIKYSVYLSEIIPETKEPIKTPVKNTICAVDFRMVLSHTKFS